jgi:hypothetical protein
MKSAAPQRGPNASRHTEIRPNSAKTLVLRKKSNEIMNNSFSMARPECRAGA